MPLDTTWLETCYVDLYSILAWVYILDILYIVIFAKNLFLSFQQTGQRKYKCKEKQIIIWKLHLILGVLSANFTNFPQLSNLTKLYEWTFIQHIQCQYFILYLSNFITQIPWWDTSNEKCKMQACIPNTIHLASRITVNTTSWGNHMGQLISYNIQSK